jgi:hypothetical protein
MNVDPKNKQDKEMSGGQKSGEGKHTTHCEGNEGKKIVEETCKTSEELGVVEEELDESGCVVQELERGNMRVRG